MVPVPTTWTIFDILLYLQSEQFRIPLVELKRSSFRNESASKPLGAGWRVTDAEGAEVGPAVVIGRDDVAGHAHFRFQKGGWQIETVLLGEHLAEE